MTLQTRVNIKLSTFNTNLNYSINLKNNMSYKSLKGSILMSL